MRLIKKTKSVCPVCFLKIDANIFEESNQVYMFKKCPEHGESKILLEKDYFVYSKLMNQKPCKETSPPYSFMIPLTHKCNLDCKVCYLPYYKQKDLTLEDVKKLIKESEAYQIRLSGGEPTLREDLPEIIRYISELGRESCLLTNGIKLEDEGYVKKLMDSKLVSVHFPLDSLNENELLEIEGKPHLQKKLKAFENLKKNHGRVALSTLLVRDVNENALKDILNFYLKNSDVINQWRIRSSVQIGKHTGVQPYSLSELLDKLCELIGIKKEGVLKDYSKKKNYRSIPCSLNIWLFYYKYKHLDNYEFILAEVNSEDVWKMRHSKFKKFYFGKKILKQRGLKELLRYLLKKARNKGKVMTYHIKLKSWPSKYTIDLEEITYCPSRTLCEDLVIRPFCYGLVFNEKIIGGDKVKGDLS